MVPDMVTSRTGASRAMLLDARWPGNPGTQEAENRGNSDANRPTVHSVWCYTVSVVAVDTEPSGSNIHAVRVGVGVRVVEQGQGPGGIGFWTFSLAQLVLPSGWASGWAQESGAKPAATTRHAMGPKRCGLVST